MCATRNLLALDLGAESGRAVLGRLDDDRLVLEEIHRFLNQPVLIGDNLHWDVLRLFLEIKQGLRMAAERCGGPAELAGVGVDTWGVDFGLLGKGDELLGNPYHYRDKRTRGVIEEALKRVREVDIFAQTGVQFLELNTLYQLLAMRLQGSPLLEAAETLLLMPGLFSFFLTGEKLTERTIAATSQMYNPRTGDWSRPLLDSLGIPTRFLTEIVPPGTVVGPLLPSVADEIGGGHASGLRVIAPAAHDTASAVAAVPETGKSFAHISSGTWMIAGVEIGEPVISDEVIRFNFANEGGVGTVRLCRNIMGLWLIQRCRRSWELAGDAIGYEEITESARLAEPFQAMVDPDCPRFVNPVDMPGEIQGFCSETGQPVPQTRGEIARTVLESLALKARWVIDKLELITSERIRTIHIVGGGTKNVLLSRFIAGATGRTVVAGPVEATAIGNIMVQAQALGFISTIEDARSIVRKSFPLVEYRPEDAAGWDEAYARFEKLL